MMQESFEDYLARKPKFNGPEYDHDRDQQRLSGQIKRVYDVMITGEKFTLERLSELADAPPASVSAQLRHLRKPRFGGHTIEKEHLGNGLYKYWMVI